MKNDYIRNKVTEAGIEEINLLDFEPKFEFTVYDMVPLLHQGLVLRENEFKAELSKVDWYYYSNKVVAVTCSNDAIVPQWSYMLIAAKLKGVAHYASAEDINVLRFILWRENLLQEDFSKYKDKKVTLKASEAVPESVYMVATDILSTTVKTLMYGEPGMPKVIFKN